MTTSTELPQSIDHLPRALPREPGSKVPAIDLGDEAFVPVYAGRDRFYFARIDSDDLPLIAPIYWNIHSEGYAGACSSTILMHRLVMGFKPGDGNSELVVDHINGQKLDNRRSNLRVLTRAQNAQNTSARNGRRGVSWCEARQKWVASAKLEGRSYHLGYFDDELAADEVVREWRRANMPYANPERD